MNCPICHEKNLNGEEKDHMYYGKSHFFRCERCGHSFFSIPDEQRLDDKNFTDSYVENHKPTELYVKKEPLSLDTSLLQELSIFYLISTFKHLGPNAKILEIGPGHPGIYRTLRQVDPDFDLYAIEPNKHCQEALESEGVEIVGDFFPMQDHSKYQGFFDLIIMRNVFYYFLEPQDAKSKLYEILAPNGALYIDMVNQEIVDSEYFSRNPLIQVYSKKSLETLFTDDHGEIAFSEFSSMDNSRKYFLEREKKRKKKKSALGKLKNIIINRLGGVSLDAMIAHMSQAKEFRQVMPNGGRHRFVYLKK